ncbi:hypothetical protein V6N13_113872 [Hibiscus sabdariffa]
MQKGLRRDGFSVYGYKLMVKKAYQTSRGVDGARERGMFQSRKEERKKNGINNVIREPPRDDSLKKVVGHVNDEDLWNLQKCLVGETTSVCSVKSIVDKVKAWCLNGIRVQRMGEDSSECSSRKVRNGDDMGQSSLNEKDVDKQDGGSTEQEACVFKSHENENTTPEHDSMVKTINSDGITKNGFEAEGLVF